MEAESSSVLTEESPRDEGSGEKGGFDPQDLRSAYKLPATGGSTSTIAIVDAYNDPNAESDLEIYRQRYGLRACTQATGCFKKVNALGEAGNYPIENSEWSQEISLDLDMVSAACAECHILLVEANNEEVSSLGTAEEEAVALGASAISNSWNFGFERNNPVNENATCGKCWVTSEEEASYDHYFDHPGTPIFFAAGDYGYAVRYPAVSPNVISVGGTTLTKEAGSARGWQEEVWSNSNYRGDEKGRGTSSGCSLYESKPAWQSDGACSKRIQNDVSAIGDPRTPVSVYDSYGFCKENIPGCTGGWRIPGGTSASSPFVAGVQGLATSYARSLGAAAFYKESSKLFGVTKGNNGECTPPQEDEYFCTARAAYSGPAGNGTPDAPLTSTAASPSARTEPATAATPNAATLHGAVAPSDLETAYHFEFGISASYGNSTGAVSAGSGTASEKVSGAIADLEPDTTYHYRLVATNGAGTSDGEDRSFKTAAPTVTGTSPNRGVAAGGNSVTISGGNFVGVSAVSFGRIPATSFKVESETQLSAVSPAQAGGVDVTVATPAGTSRSNQSDRFAYTLGPLLTWGLNNDDLGNGLTANRATPVEVSGQPQALAISAGGDHSLALLENGQVLAWGEEYYGELGDGTTQTPSAVPVKVCAVGASGPCPGGPYLEEVTAVSAGWFYSLALLKNGTVVAWGENYYGQLGTGNEALSDVPVPVCTVKESPCQPEHYLKGVSAIAAGRQYSLALLENHSVVAWGDNKWGELGIGSSSGPEICVEEYYACSKIPITVSGLTEVSALAAGAEHALALLSSGMVMAWGYNEDGELGDGTSTGPDTCQPRGYQAPSACSTTPVTVSSLTDVSAITADSFSSLALTKEGTVMSWGNNCEGQLGDGEGCFGGTTEGPEKCGLESSRPCSMKPVPVCAPGEIAPCAKHLGEVSAIAAGAIGSTNLALLTGGAVLAWGGNIGGDLGDGKNRGEQFKAAVPVRVCAAYVEECSSGPYLEAVTTIMAGDGFNLAIRPEPPTVTNVQPNVGLLGTGTKGTKVTISGSHFTGATAVKFGAANASSFTVDSDGSITAITPPGAGTVDVTVTARGEGSETSPADKFAYRRGAALAWGRGEYGQLGDGGEAVSALPRQISGLGEVLGVQGGGNYSLALLPGGSGTVYGFGENAAGQLGDGSKAKSSAAPVEVCAVGVSECPSGPYLEGVAATAAGFDHGLALLKEGGTVVAWGENEVGQVGDGTSTGPETCEYFGSKPCNRTPLKVCAVGVSECPHGPYLEGVVAIAAGYKYSLALLKSGAVVAWGANGDGQLGDGSTASSDVPVEVPGLSEVSAIAAGEGQALALLVNGTVMAWGYNEQGELGNGSTENSDVPVQVPGLSEVTGLAGGGAHSLALLASGAVMAWGLDQDGQLGDGPSESYELCKLGGGGSYRCAKKPVAVKGLSEATAIAAGYSYSLALLRNGTSMAWGENADGELGDGTTSGPEKCKYRLAQTEAPCSMVPVAVSGLTDAADIAAGRYHALAAGQPLSYRIRLAFSSQVELPFAVAVRPTGGLLVSESAASRVEKFSSEGIPEGQLGSAGSGPCQYSDPRGIAIGSSGDVWIVDAGNRRLDELSPAGECIRVVQGRFTEPWGVAIDSSGDIWVTDLGAERVEELSSEGNPLGQFGREGTGPGEFRGPTGIAADSDGHLWVVDTGGDRIEELSETGEYLGQIGSTAPRDTPCTSLFCWPQAVSVDQDGHIFAGNGSNSIDEFSETGELITQFGSFGSGEGEMEWPRGLAAIAVGSVWVADFGNNRIERWSPSY